jgi:dihydropteroate synthase
VAVGGGRPVVVMGALNVSRESFHAGSVYRADDDLLKAATAMVAAGAALLDVGARSSAPYRTRDVGEAEEAERLGHAVALLVREIAVPVSADTCRPAPARAALDAGARVLNDVSGLRDEAVAALAARHRAGVILMAAPEGVAAPRTGRGRAPRGRPRPEPIATVARLLRGALARARGAGIPAGRIVVDPGIGFFRSAEVAWPEWDLRVLAGLGALRALGRPICVGVSRKSFIGATTGRAAPADRLAGSLAAAALAVWHGAALVRTHDVAQTADAVRVAEGLRAAARATIGGR